MGTNRRNSQDKRCQSCLINKAMCICQYLYPRKITTPIQIIMHYKEKKLTSNTANLISQIHNECKIYHRGEKESSIDYDTLLMKDTHTPLYLFPSDHAVELNSDFIKGLQKPINLIVPDGSWGQAKKIKRRESKLNFIQSVTLPKGLSSNYKLRTTIDKNKLSTFEAIAKAVGIIEGKEIQESLNKVFEVFVERTLMGRNGIQNPLLSDQFTL